MSTGEVLLQGRNMCKSYQQGKKSNSVLNDVNIEIYEGDFTVIMGSSGAGKSTLLYCLSGMDFISDGEVLYQGEEISRYREKQMAALRTKEFGFVFQQTCLVSNLTLFENVAVAGYVSRGRKAKEVQEKAGELLTRMCVEFYGKLHDWHEGIFGLRGRLERNSADDPGEREKCTGKGRGDAPYFLGRQGVNFGFKPCDE